MAFLLTPSDHVGRDVKRAARERLDHALDQLDRLDGDVAAVEEHVHETRKRCKEARALARVARPALGRDFDRFNARVRDAAAELSPIRDAHAALTTIDRLRAAAPDACDASFELVRAGQAELTSEAADTFGPSDPRLTEARRLLAAARRDVDRWDLPRGFEAIERGLQDTYRRGQRLVRRAARTPGDDLIHEWRKAVKQLWYQVRLLEPAAPSVLGPLETSLDGIAEALGDDHDLAVLLEHLAAAPDRYGGAVAIADVGRVARARQDDLRADAFRLAFSVYAERPGSFVARLRAYWHITLDHGPEPEMGGNGALPATPAAPA